MTFEEMYALACQRKKDMPEGKGTTELFKKGPHGIGKKLVEEAAESWMAARFESRDAQCLELSQVLYYVAVMYPCGSSVWCGRSGCQWPDCLAICSARGDRDSYGPAHRTDTYRLCPERETSQGGRDGDSVETHRT